MIDRRDFLQRLAALPFLVGAWNFQDEKKDEPRVEEQKKPRALDLGLERMRSGDRFGLVFVVPKDADERLELGRMLLRLHELKPTSFERSSIQTRRGAALAATCVFICMEREEAKAAFSSTSGCFVIDAKGKALRALERAPGDLDDEPFAQLQALVHGSGLEHLEARVKRHRAGLDAKLDERVTALISAMHADRTKDWIPRRESAKTALRAKEARLVLDEHPVLVSWFVLALMRSKDESELTPPSALQSFVESIAEAAPIPVGSVMPRFHYVGCCADFIEDVGQPAPRPSDLYCGRSHLTSLGGRFLRFVGDADRKPEAR